MSTETAPEQQKERPKCGRLVFRGVELAYLNIDGEYMLPLAELLALVLPTTPRTTLFTRMEKMKVRRHFCQPEEIKLLKTVNGIHGSSANCTLLCKTEVEKYCSMYIDNFSESNKGKCVENITSESLIASEEVKAERCNSKLDLEEAQRNNNEIPNKLAVLHKHKKSPSLKAKLKFTKVTNTVKLKSGLSCVSQFNQTLTDSISREAIDGDVTCGSVDERAEDILRVSPSLFSAHASNLQTQPWRANNKRMKKRDKNLNSEANKKGKLSQVKKRPSNDMDIGKEFESPLKIPKRSEIRADKGNNKVSETRQFPIGRSLHSSQKQDFDSLISDSLSIDSGFASTVLSNASTPTKTEFSAGELNGLLRKDEEVIKEHEHSSPRRPPKLKTPTKNKISEDEGNSLTLSPPALVLKRYEDSWKIEQKSPVKEDKEATNCLLKSKVKLKKKARPDGLTTLFQETCGNAQAHIENKQVKKRRKRRKPLNFKEETLINKELIIGEKPDGAGIKKKRAKRKQKGKLVRGTLSNKQFVGPQKSRDFSTAKEKKPEVLPQEKPNSETQFNTEQTKVELLKKNSVLDRLVGDALDKFFGRNSSNETTLTPSSENITPTKPKPKKRKIATVTKPVLKTNSSFKLLNWFPLTSQLSLQCGSLSPVFTMSCPKSVEPSTSHPLWKWSLGGPVVRNSDQKFVKPKPVSTPKEKQSDSTSKLVANKVRKLKRRRRKKLSTSKKPLTCLSNNATILDSKANQNASGALTEFTLPACDQVTSIVSSPAEITVS